MSLPADAISTPPSHPRDGMPRRIAVVGGGIAGLAAAHRVGELEPAAEVTLFEASDRLGGVLRSDRRDGWLIERSADMFTTREPWALDLCRRIGIADELIETDARFRRAFVARRGRLVPVPEGFTLMSPAKVWPILTTPLLSPLGKLRLAGEYFVRCKQDSSDESLESFVVRRFGREAFDRLIQPLIGGIYTADPARLSMQATLPQFVALERQHGSLIRGMRRKPAEMTGKGAAVEGQGSGARYGQFVAPQGGMQRLVDALAGQLPAGTVRLQACVDRIERVAHNGAEAVWQVSVCGHPQPDPFDALILAAPAPQCTRLLAFVNHELAALVGQIPYAGCSVAVLGVRRDQIAHPLDGFGFVVPAIEKRRILAGSMASVKFPGRAPEGHVLLRVFVGGALQPALAELPDDETRSLVLAELGDLMGLSGQPEFCEIARWLGAMPQYHIGHLSLVEAIEQRTAAIPGLALAGNAYRGVGIPQCIKSGEAAAERILGPKPAHLQSPISR
jgi:oxygen-dependent protoporphyrinogen oxidase